MNIYKKSFGREVSVSTRTLRSRIRKGIYSVITENIGDNVVGFALLYNIGNTSHIDYIAIDEGHRGKGLAGKLLDKVITFNGDLSLECDNHLISFYSKFGFHNTGTDYRFHGHKMNIMARREKNKRQIHNIMKGLFMLTREIDRVEHGQLRTPYIMTSPIPIVINLHSFSKRDYGGP